MVSTNADNAPTTPDDDDRFMVQVSESLPSLEECYQFVAAAGGSGAVSTFVGITRDNFQGKRVLRLEYEGYIPMAEKELRKLCRDACLKYTSIQKIAAVHILGECPVGKASVILAASSPHRREAMHCAEYMIDELKRRVPIWKRVSGCDIVTHLCFLFFSSFLILFGSSFHSIQEVYEGDEGSVWKENAETREMERVVNNN